MRITKSNNVDLRWSCNECYRPCELLCIDTKNSMLVVCPICLKELRQAIDPLKVLVSTGINTK
jgi:hypothetical protein